MPNVADERVVQAVRIRRAIHALAAVLLEPNAETLAEAIALQKDLPRFLEAYAASRSSI